MYTRSTLIKALRVCVFLIFIGRAYQYLFFDAPFRALLWDESLLKPIVEGLFGINWFDYVTNLNVDAWIQRCIKINGVIFVIAGITALIINSKNRKYLKFPILIGASLLVVLSILNTKEMFFHYGQFFEHSIQFGVPFILLIAIKETFKLEKIIFYLKVLIAVTFTAHGLYALGYYPIPGHFIDMTIRSLGVTEDTAVIMLNAAGILDLLLSIFIFVPKVSKYVLFYAFLWGTVTALARIVGTINFDFIGSSLHQTFYQVIYRLPHGFIPLLVLYMQQKYSITQKKLIHEMP